MLLFLTTNMATVTSRKTSNGLVPNWQPKASLRRHQMKFQPTEKFEQTLRSHCSIFLLYLQGALNG